jgi:glycosyltransferase involved in cell wall biosynthesis
MPPLISILLPVANGAEFLWESLSSVIAQTYTEWECWVALNGEGLKGPAEAIVRALDHPNIHILHQPTVTNKAEALNNVLPYAKGDWIALLDVDDRWAPHKLAKQVAATHDTKAIVIGTAARYFGEFHGIPAIPTGPIAAHTLCEVNPIINSSVLIHRDSFKIVPSVLYPSQIPGACEDYFLWMRIGLVTAVNPPFFNLPDILVDHRIHKASAFNSRQDDPRPLQEWYRRQRTVPQAPITILTTVCNSPHFIRAQAKALRTYVGVPYEFVVFNDAKAWPDATNFGDPTMRQQIEETCRELGIRCIPIANEGHRYQSSASQRHCETLRVVMDFVRKHSGRYWMLDSDMWPVGFYGPAEIAEKFTGAGTFVRQTRGATVYAWPNLWWINTSNTDIHDLCWDLAPGCDTGGASATWVKRMQPQWLDPHRSSGTWGIQDLPEHLKTCKDLQHFLASDPRNQGEALWAELYDDRIFHVRAGSNWNGEGAAVHQQIADLTRPFGYI